MQKNQILQTKTGIKIPKLDLTPEMLIDKSIVIYGASKSGKTVAIKNLMHTLRGRIDQALVVSPSEASNHSYAGYIDKPFIHYDFNLRNSSKKQNDTTQVREFLQAIYKRQELMTSIYDQANNPRTLDKLFQRLPAPIQDEARSFILQAREMKKRSSKRLDHYYQTENEKQKKIHDLSSRFEEMRRSIYKKYIIMHYNYLWALTDLSERERLSLRYIKLNPRLLLILDDCAAQMKTLLNIPEMRALFYQNRHLSITVIISCQDDTDLNSNLRKQAFISIFTEPRVCAVNFNRSSNGYTKELKNMIEDIASCTFQGHRKLAYIRNAGDQEFFYLDFELQTPFRFGSQALHELCKLVQKDGISIDKENPYYNLFKLR